MQALTDKQVEEIGRIIHDHHLAFIINVMGSGDLVVNEEEFERLRSEGLIDKSVKSYTDDAFVFGLLTDALREANRDDLSYNEFKKHMADNPVPLTEEERAAIKHLKRSMATHIVGLGNTVEKRTRQVIVDADQGLRRRMASTISNKLVEGAERRKSMQAVAEELRRSTGDAARDFLRIAATELHNARQEGKLQTIIKSNRGRDPYVFKRPSPKCCGECRTTYMTKSGVPRLFRLSELVANGSNVGRGESLRKAVVGSHHPWCQCELQEMPPGFEFDKKGNMTYVGLKKRS